MSINLISATDALTQLQNFNTIIDARSPSEFAQDRLPSAVNWPSLTDEERRIVGTDYKQIGGFEAKKLGAAMVARNVATHIDREVQNKPKHWQPLVYCWRGGKRSGTLAWFLDQIGFRTTMVDGGYKAFRAAMVHDMDQLAPKLHYRVICGKTGSGKTRLLQALAKAGEQIIDLEGLAEHRGSVLGHLPEQPQPSQKHFESRLWHALKQCDPTRTVWVESESKKIGNLRVPESLIQTMRQHGQCVLLELPMHERVGLLLEDYAFYTQNPELFNRHLEALIPLRGKALVHDWQTKALAGDFAGVFEDLMVQHYDPAYSTSTRRNYAQFDASYVIAASARSALTQSTFATKILADMAALS
jgi:tRNA 2-selenouridine synthase